VIENKPGAATNLGADFVAKAAPDGYTVLLGDVATYAAKQSVTRSSNSTLAPTHGYEAARESSM
jgi:tripartite-type tricarboxylate transporter receptor subunit TctC